MRRRTTLFAIALAFCVTCFTCLTGPGFAKSQKQKTVLRFQVLTIQPLEVHCIVNSYRVQRRV